MMRGRRPVAVVLVVVLGLALVACGGSSSEESGGESASNATSAASDGYPYDLSDEGDDLLADEVTSFEFGRDAPISWRFPDFYADGEADETSTFIEVGDALFTIQVVAGTGTTPRARAEEAAEQLEVGDESIHDVRFGDRDWVTVVDDSAPVRRVVFYGALPKGVVAGAVFTSTVPLAEVPPERIDELHQLVLSIREDTAAG